MVDLNFFWSSIISYWLPGLHRPLRLFFGVGICFWSMLQNHHKNCILIMSQFLRNWFCSFLICWIMNVIGSMLQNHHKTCILNLCLLMRSGKFYPNQHRETKLFQWDRATEDRLSSWISLSCNQIWWWVYYKLRISRNACSMLKGARVKHLIEVL